MNTIEKIKRSIRRFHILPLLISAISCGTDEDIGDTQFELNATELDFGEIETMKTIELTNRGSSDFEFTFTSNDRVSVIPAEGTLVASSAIAVNLRIDREGMENDLLREEVIFSVNGVEQEVIVLSWSTALEDKGPFFSTIVIDGQVQFLSEVRNEYSDDVSDFVHYWDFGDGLGFNSNEKNPLYSYRATGEYEVTLEYDFLGKGTTRAHVEVGIPDFLGSKWEQEADPNFEGRMRHSSFVFDDKIWVLGGVGNLNLFSDIWYSENGKDWVLATENPGWDARAGQQVIVFKNEIWLIGGEFHNDVWKSSDGFSWIEVVEDAPWGARSGHGVVVLNDNIFLTGGSRPDGAIINDVWISEDGMIWSELTNDAPWNGRAQHELLKFENQLWLIGGVGLDSHHIWKSQDGISWESIQPYFRSTNIESTASMVYDGRIWLFGGISQFISKNTVLYSYNGHDWVKVAPLELWPPRHSHSVVSFLDKVYVIGGRSDGSVRNEVWSTSK
ncbi:MAG: kelch repeat-containing protein [Cyclobacteriaceae bacterium]